MTGSQVIRLLLLTRETFPTFRVDVDKLFGKELIGRGHEIDLVMQAAGSDILSGPTPWRGRTVWVGKAPRSRGPLKRVEAHVRSFVHDVACLLRLARKDRYDAVQVRNKFLIGALACLIVRSRGLKFFYWLSFPVPESQARSGQEGTARFPTVNRIRGKLFGFLLYRIILPKCDHAFVQSQRMKEDLCAMGADGAKLTPVPMGIDLDDFPARGRSPDRRAQDGEPLLFGYLGTLGAQRKLDILIDALDLLCGAGVNAKLLMVGGSNNPEDRAMLERRARALGVSDRVEMTGMLPREQALERMQDVDVALSPFFPTMILQSTSPTKLVEYMALGLPVVANHHPEQKQILRLSRAGICVPWSARHFARGMRWLAGIGHQERSQLGERGRAWVIENRGYARIADGVELKYQELLSNVTTQGRQCSKR